MKTYIAKAADVKRKWYIVDAENKVLGRLSTQIATILRGKNKPEYHPAADNGDFVVVINAEKIMLTSNKANQKVYRHHSGYLGGLKEVSYKTMLEKHPERIIQAAVKGMLPKNTLGRQMYKKLKVYAGTQHPHAAQNPELIEL